jgi:acetyltransferase
MNECTPDLRYLFDPRSVAVIGASGNRAKVGYKILDSIIHDGYTGEVYGVNPKGGVILGRRVHTSVTEIDGPVDMAVIAIPASLVFDAVRECAKKGVRYLVIVTSGFSEVGNSAEEAEMVEFAASRGMRILGPNIFGIFSSRCSLNATWGTRDIQPGNVALITQSGALGAALMGRTKTENIGLSAVIPLGNKADLDEADMLEYLIPDERTDVILIYAEGIKKGDRLVPVLHRAASVKPVIVIKSGRSSRGAIAAASHTGSLAGEDGLFDDILKQCGVMRAESITEAMNWCRFFSRAAPLKGENAVIITNGGGMGVLAADACEKYGVRLYDDVESLGRTFAPHIPSFGSYKNPVDTTGQANIGDMRTVVEAAVEDPDIHSIICLGCETAMLDLDSFGPTIEEIFDKNAIIKPIVFSFLGGRRMEEAISSLRGKGLPIFPEIYEAVSCLGALVRHRRQTLSHIRAEDNDEISLDLEALQGAISSARGDGRTFLLSGEARRIMDAVGVSLPRSMMATSLKEAVEAADSIGYPVVMKVVSRDIIHKSDAGGVALDLVNRKEVMDAYEAIMHKCRAYDPSARIKGVEVTEMVVGGTETIIGARNDRTFGPVVMFGMGGVYVEVLKDVSFRSAPLDRDEVMRMLQETKSFRILLGVRGEKRKDIDSVVDTVMKLSLLIRICDDIGDIEINPLTVYEDGKGVRALDVRVLLKKPEEGERNEDTGTGVKPVECR